MGTVAQLFESPVSPRFAPDDLRAAEALVFAAAEPLDEAAIAARLSPEADVKAVMAELQRHYTGRGVNLVRVAGRWPKNMWLDVNVAVADEGSHMRGELCNEVPNEVPSEVSSELPDEAALSLRKSPEPAPYLPSA